MAQGARESNKPESRYKIIKAIQTPLGYFTLSMLILEALLAIALMKGQPEDVAFIVRGAIVIAVLLIAIVALLAFFRPGALSATGAERAGEIDPVGGARELGENTYNPTTLRGIRLMEAAERAGLQDIENRDDDEYSLPPEAIYGLVKREIVISGVTLSGTFSKHLDHVLGLISEGRHVYVVLSKPGSQGLSVMSERVDRQLDSELDATLHTIRARNLHRQQRFHLKFVEDLPFTGVMIDGDVNAKEKPQDDGAVLRVQPRGVHTSQHRGVVLQVVKRSTPPQGIIDFFADDVRYQWQTLAKADPGLFERAES